MKRILVKSSTLRSLAFDAEHNILETEFSNGSVYQYFGVPQRIYEGLLRATSKGSYLNIHIRDRYPTRKVEDEPD